VSLAAFTQVSGYAPLLLITAGQGIAAGAINPLADSLVLALAAKGRLDYGPVRAVGSAAFMLATAAAD
jgi:PPP family 3-phenylpropionic acid transporter